VSQEITPADIIDFWYDDETRKQWFSSTPELDSYIRTQYESIWQQAKAGRLDSWQSSPEGCLALTIILDQFPLNMYRGKPESFSTESDANAVSKWAIEKGFDQLLPAERRVFLYMPLMHSENMDDQNMSVSKYEAAGLEDNVRFAQHHRNIVQRFGRFPHRNEILGRESSQEELDWLATDEAFKG
jgi:uncharacterized protein (DUF924 family)